jgi:CBS-domain-containing membrane protein
VVYESVRSWDDFQPWLDRVLHFPEEVVDDALKQLPPEWLEEDREEVERLLTRLMTRRRRVSDLIQDSTKGRINPFPNWRS